MVSIGIRAYCDLFSVSANLSIFCQDLEKSSKPRRVYLCRVSLCVGIENFKHLFCYCFLNQYLYLSRQTAVSGNRLSYFSVLNKMVEFQRFATQDDVEHINEVHMEGFFELPPIEPTTGDLFIDEDIPEIQVSEETLER